MEGSRRAFINATASAFAVFAMGGCTRPPARSAATRQLGPLVTDPAGLIDLAEGFSYRVLSSLGDAMSDGNSVPDHADGMGCFDLGDGRLALIRNHELNPGQDAGTHLASGYGKDADGNYLPGGTTTIILDAESLQVLDQFRSLQGTMRNCAGGTTPWGSWLTCEEPNIFTSRFPEHGFVFEVPATATGPVEPVPYRAMGRFNHEAAAVDPATGIVYMTEDQTDGLFYRYIPAVPGRLGEGGSLQALVIDGIADTSNRDAAIISPGVSYRVRWVLLDNVEAPEDDLRHRGAVAGASMFSRAEGLHMGDGEMFFCCTSGGAAGLGQIFRYTPDREGGGQLELFFESETQDQLNFGDNLTVTPKGHLIVCEDQYTETVENHLRWLTPDGEIYPFARNRLQSELAGACFSPDGRTLFVNIFSPARTVAITGPWPS